ncbi:uncharacterized protein FIBRA_01907 [Fibroporia radiculosa]|uniref:Uncharacterized protein n=1 Tax=Fibroporia radiculosa TaxID=599839 RepID=J4HU34_9APHY|nr:uncharacterized protein FIBRA_01907 [Fibroporia radiculosa]CCL99882.1 predicted protein [Fibroporia radiculosa]
MSKARYIPHTNQPPLDPQSLKNDLQNALIANVQRVHGHLTWMPGVYIGLSGPVLMDWKLSSLVPGLNLASGSTRTLFEEEISVLHTASHTSFLETSVGNATLVLYDYMALRPARAKPKARKIHRQGVHVLRGALPLVSREELDDDGALVSYTSGSETIALTSRMTVSSARVTGGNHKRHREARAAWCRAVQGRAGGRRKGSSTSPYVAGVEKDTLVGHMGLMVPWCTWDGDIPTHTTLMFGDGFALSAPLADDITEALKRGGERVYTRGLVTKGVGLCYGIAGSVYALLAVAGALDGSTSTRYWFSWAVHLAHLATDYQALERNGKMRIADRPYSLYEGVGGMCCAWAEVLARMKLSEEQEEDEDEVNDDELIEPTTAGSSSSPSKAKTTAKISTTVSPIKQTTGTAGSSKSQTKKRRKDMKVASASVPTYPNLTLDRTLRSKMLCNLAALNV